MKLLPAILAILAYCHQAQAVYWYFLRYWVPSGGQFTQLSGQMKIPTLPKAGVYYLWPGLQPTDNSGVYQNVLDGRSGTWWIGSGWCCSNPSLPWGGGFNTYGGETVAFSNVRSSSTWTSTLTRQSTGATVTNTFALTSKSFNQALFAIELTGVSWDFGALEFDNVVIVMTGSSSTGWCTGAPENYNSASNYAITGASASVSGTTVTCRISKIVLSGPR